jgi:hypothetical protein
MTEKDTHSGPYSGQCHCGAVQFTVTLQTGLADAVRCNCTLCRMRGAVVAFAHLADLELTSGADHLATYQFHTKTAKHHFCKICGIYTHHQRRFDPNLYAVNVACLDGVSPFDFAAMPVMDGAYHPADHGGGPVMIIGNLRFEPGT